MLHGFTDLASQRWYAVILCQVVRYFMVQSCLLKRFNFWASHCKLPANSLKSRSAPAAD